ncbi:MAG: ComF family protein [Methylobacteriaceae bacterium]|jgi:ComF family protein|nr:ComF family protein [Methylobacteriaceae bacterium]
MRTGLQPVDFVASAVLNLLYPPCCLVCKTPVDEADSLCPACWRQMRFIEAPFCPRSGVPFTFDTGEGLVSPTALADPPEYNRARAGVLYVGTARTLVHQLKYHDSHNLAPGMARIMAHAGRELLAEADVLIPVPLHYTRLWKRRFNQAAILARHISALSGKPCDMFSLRRVRHTAPQFSRTRAQRRDNVRAAFQVADERRDNVRGKRVVLIDDVLTTGATVNAAARGLLRAGATAVDVLTFALTPPPGLDRGVH